MNTTSNLRQQIADDFRTNHAAAGDQAKVGTIAQSIEQAADSSVGANGSIASVLFWVTVGVTTNDGHKFNGDAWGVGTPGGGALFGDVYSDDFDALYANTVSFEVNSTPVYLSVLFFDGDGTLLGHFQCGAVSTIAGVFGGNGSWA